MPAPETNGKRFIQEQDLLLDGYRLGVRIYNSGFRPDFIVGIWRGGSSVGIVVQECLQYFGVDTDHISIRTSYRGQSTYQHLIEHADTIRVHGAQYLYETMNAGDSLLIVDDVYSSGLNVKAVIDRLTGKMRKNMPARSTHRSPLVQTIAQSDGTGPGLLSARDR